MAAMDNGDNSHCRTPVGFIEEIDFQELDIKEPVGKGSFGVVYEAVYRKIPVAVKMIESESERIAFITELRQLSRVSHKNIIQLYGACSSPVSLVMELAECGSLYNLLHGLGPLPHYTGGHAMSWCLQCARGVAYLHSMKPKALVHRDLKPPNLLLTNFGTTLKICDFGTACDIHTHMTNNKGSAAWMAPEVFEGCQYSERCDVFSWGIIFWEVLTRRKPFDELGGPAFRIMWAVHVGARPPLIQNCPKPIEDLMTKCWSKVPDERPSMDQVVSAMERLLPFFSGYDEPLLFPCDDEDQESFFDSETTDGSFSGTQTSNLSDTMHATTTNPRIPPGVMNIRSETSSPVFKAAERARRPPRSGSQSPVPSAAAKKGHRRSSSFGNTLELPRDMMREAALAEISKNSKRRRSSTELIADIEKSPLERVSPVHSRSSSPSSRHLRKVSSSGTSSPLLLTPSTKPVANIPTVVPALPVHKRHVSDEDDYAYADPNDDPAITTNSVSMAYLTLELHLQPLPPSGNSKESLQIYEDHCQLAQEYLRVQTEIAMLRSTETHYSKELEQVEKDKEVNKLAMEYQQLMERNKELTQLSQKMRTELDVSRGKQQQRMM